MANLRHFDSSQLLISRDQAADVLKFFFPDQSPSPASLTIDDIGFAQALLIEAVDASREMGYVEVLFDKAFMKVPSDYSFVTSIAKAFCKKAIKNWFRHATGEDLANPSIYESVRRTLARNFRSVWAIRLQTGELTY